LQPDDKVNLPKKVKSFLVTVVERMFRDLRWSAMTGETTLATHAPKNGSAEYRPFCQQHRHMHTFV